MVNEETTRFQQEQDEESRYRIIQRQQGLAWEQSKPLLLAALGDQSWRVRKLAVEQISAVGCLSADDREQLVCLLRDEDNAGLRNSVAELLINLGMQSVEILVRHLHDSDHDVRKQLVDILGAIGGTEALQALPEMLSDHDVNVAAAAAEALGASGDSSFAQALVTCLEQSEDQFFRYNLLSALGKIGVPGPLPAVIRKMLSDSLLGRAVYECLGRIGGDCEAVELLLCGIKTGLPSLRQAAICSLASVVRHIPDAQTEHVKNRLQCATNEGLLEQLSLVRFPSGTTVDGAIISILGMISDLRTVPLLLRAQADEHLASQAEHLLESLGPAAVQAAIKRFGSCQSRTERAAICRLVGRSEEVGEDGVALINQALSDQDDDVRASAAAAVATMTVSSQLISRLLELLNDQSMLVRSAAVTALEKSAGSCLEVRDTAIRMARSSDLDQRIIAARLLVAVQGSEYLSVLLKDVEPSVREAAARAAGGLGGQEGCSHLILAMADEDPEVRIAAAEALGECRDTSAIEPLRLALHDHDPWVQAAVLKSLVQLAGQDAQADLIMLWEQGDEVVQLVCLNAFRQLATPECMRSVASRIGVCSAEVLKGAIAFLQDHAPEHLTPWLQQLIHHQDWDVRIAVVRASANLVREHEELFRNALLTEKDALVRAEISALLDRM